MHAVEERSNITVDDDRAKSEEVCNFLIKSERLNPADLKRAKSYSDQHDGDLVTLLVKLGLVSERDVAEAESSLLGLELLAANEYPDEGVENSTFSSRYLKQNLVLPIRETDEELFVVMANPRDEFALKALAMASGKQIPVTPSTFV